MVCLQTQNGLGFAKLFSGERIRKTETDFSKRFLDLDSARRKGSGEECARASAFVFFGGAGN